MKYSFVFVCQQGPLELKAMLLAASLKRHLACEHELIGAIPTPEKRWGRPSERTLSFLSGLGVRLVPISNQISPDYPIGNKVSCLDVPVDADVRVFVDSDILCLRRFAGAPEFGAPFCAKPADVDTFAASEAIWELIYASQQLSLPPERMRATVSGQMMLPYFNAGFIAAHSALALGKVWLSICRDIDADQRIANKRPWLDQIALPVAVRRLGVRYASLDERFNYPAHLRPIDPRSAPYFAHYHQPGTVAASPTLRDLARDLAAEHPPLAESMREEASWRKVLRISLREMLRRGIQRLRGA